MSAVLRSYATSLAVTPGDRGDLYFSTEVLFSLPAFSRAADPHESFDAFVDRDVVQEEELAPFVGQRVALDLNPGNVLRLTRLALQRHVGLVRGPVVFAVVAAHAGADQILPGRVAAAALGDDVVDGHQPFAARTAVLAGVLVADQDVLFG